MKRIVVVGSKADSLIYFRGALLKEMVKNGHNVFACGTNASRSTRDLLAEMGVVYEEIKLDRTGINPLYEILTFINYYKLFRRINPDIFLGYTIKPIVYGSLAARLAGVPRIFSMMEGLGYTLMNLEFKARILGLITKNLYRLALRYNYKIFFLNPDNLNVVLHKGILKDADKAIIINGIGVDIDKYKPKQYPLEITFLLIARLLRDKGIQEYAHAAKIVKRKYPKIKFVLIGPSDDHNPNAITKRERKSWVESGALEYQGRKDDVRPAISQSSVYVLPSYHEGLPVTVMEAMAMGRPIITTLAPGCRETVNQGENGLLIPIKDVPALVKAIEYFIKSPDEIQRMGDASRRIAEEKYDRDKVNSVIVQSMELNY